MGKNLIFKTNFAELMLNYSHNLDLRNPKNEEILHNLTMSYLRVIEEVLNIIFGVVLWMKKHVSLI